MRRRVIASVMPDLRENDGLRRSGTDRTPGNPARVIGLWDRRSR